MISIKKSEEENAKSFLDEFFRLEWQKIVNGNHNITCNTITTPCRNLYETKGTSIMSYAKALASSLNIPKTIYTQPPRSTKRVQLSNTIDNKQDSPKRQKTPSMGSVSSVATTPTNIDSIQNQLKEYINEELAKINGLIETTVNQAMDKKLTDMIEKSTKAIEENVNKNVQNELNSMSNQIKEVHQAISTQMKTNMNEIKQYSTKIADDRIMNMMNIFAKQLNITIPDNQKSDQQKPGNQVNTSLETTDDNDMETNSQLPTDDTNIMDITFAIDDEAIRQE